MKCPLCKEHELEIRTSKKGAKTLACADYKPQLADDDDPDSWQNFGDCEFRIPFKNKIWGELDLDDIKKLMKGEELDKEDMSMKLDLEYKFFTKVKFKNKAKFTLDD